MAIPIIYDQRDNILEVQLNINGANISDYSLLTKVRFSVNGESFDSDKTPELFIINSGSITIKAGLLGIISRGRYFCTISAWDNNHPNGIVYTSRLVVLFKSIQAENIVI